MQIRDTRNGSWYWVNTAVNSCPHITPADKCVYGALASFGGCKDIHPNYDLIASRAATVKRVAIRSVKKLIEVGYLSVEKGNGRGNSNVYTLLKVPKGCTYCLNGDKKTPFIKGDNNDVERVTISTIKGDKKDTPIDKVIDKKKITLVANATSPFSFKEELEKLRDSPRKDMKIIAFYWKRKNYQFENRLQFEKALKRELRPASQLIGYSGKQLSIAIDYCENHYGEKVPWTLETCCKRLPDLINVK